MRTRLAGAGEDMAISLAIVGRPNVGKSTLFNQLLGKQLALVDNRPGITRDYREGSIEFSGKTIRLIDTAGIDSKPDAELDIDIRQITEQALGLADVFLLLVDGRTGLIPADLETASHLRKLGKPVIVGVNKCEGRIDETVFADAFGLGFGEPHQLSAAHGLGSAELLDRVKQLTAVVTQEADTEEGGIGSDEEVIKPIRIAVVGRPNSGKSSLINSIAGTERLLTGKQPGVTRDSISIDTVWNNIPVRIHDTAGMRKRAKITDKIEKLSVADGLRSVRFAEVVLVVIDAEIPFESQDLRIADLSEREGRAIVVVANKWDKVVSRRRLLRELRHKLNDRLPNIKGAPLVPVSALTGYGLDSLQGEIEKTWVKWNKRVPTASLNEWLAEMKAVHPPPAPQGRRIRLRYVTQVKSRPPTFVFMCSNPKMLPSAYIRYLRNGLRLEFGLEGIPIRIVLRSQSEKNPYV